MKTREQLESEIRAANPTSDGNGAGHPDYEALIQRWTDNAYAAEQARIAEHRASLVLTRAQFGEMLIRKGRKAEVEGIIDAIADPATKAIMLEWYEYAPHVRRLAPKVEAIRALLDPPVDEATADAWFEEAMTYE